MIPPPSPPSQAGRIPGFLDSWNSLLGFFQNPDWWKPPFKMDVILNNDVTTTSHKSRSVDPDDVIFSLMESLWSSDPKIHYF